MTAKTPNLYERVDVEIAALQKEVRELRRRLDARESADKPEPEPTVMERFFEAYAKAPGTCEEGFRAGFKAIRDHEPEGDITFTEFNTWRCWIDAVLAEKGTRDE